MKKVLLFGAIGVGLVVAAKRLGSTMGNVDWQQRIEAMPDNAPPKWMFRNISAIRDNTERILGLLEGETHQPSSPVTAASEVVREP